MRQSSALIEKQMIRTTMKTVSTMIVTVRAGLQQNCYEKENSRKISSAFRKGRDVSSAKVSL